MKKCLGQYEQLEEKRGAFLKDILEKYIEAQEAFNQGLQECSTILKEKIEAINYSTDMGNFLREKKTNLSPPPLVEYEIYNSSVPLDYRLDSSGSTNTINSAQPTTTVATTTTTTTATPVQKTLGNSPSNPSVKASTAPTNINPLSKSVGLGASQDDIRPREDSKSKPLPVPNSKKDTNPNMPQKRAKAQYDYDAEEDNELSFKENDIIIITKIDDSGWWEGSIGARSGMFPGNYVELIPEEVVEKAKPLPTPAAKSTQSAQKQPMKKERKCKAIFDFSGDGDDELSINEGDIITILSEAEGWMLGVNKNGSQGLFPANHVEEII